MEGNEEKEAIEEFIKSESCTELDAIHPRFMGPQDPEVIRDYQIRHDFYCDQCKLFFAPTLKALSYHFYHYMIQHKPCASCFYCQGHVFEYKFNNERKIYHDCRKSSKKEDSHSSGP